MADPEAVSAGLQAVGLQFSFNYEEATFEPIIVYPPPTPPPSPPPSPPPPSPPPTSAVSTPNSPPPPSPSPPPAAPKTIEPDRDYTAVKATATVTGTLAEWEAPARRAAFEAACEKAFAGAQCFLDDVKAGSVVLDFSVVQYADEAKGRSIADQFADGAVVAAFRSAVLAATGSTFEAAPTVVSVTAVGKDGKVTYSSNISGGAVAGIVVGCVVVATMCVGVGIYACRNRRAAPSAPVKTPTRDA